MIPDPPPPKPLNLSEWLETATGGLVPSAQARIQAEIAAHHAEAVQTKMAGGLAEPAAHQAALAELGDAGAAAVRFRREYLTTEDISRLDVGTGSWRILLIVMALGQDFILRHGLAWMAFKLGLVLLVMGNVIALYLLSRGRTELATLPRLILLATINWLMIGFMSSGLCLTATSAFNFYGSMGLFLVAVYATVRCLCLHRKLLTD